MSLLREIQDAATDQSTNTATLLRKCKILAVRLGNEEFKQWIDNELNGYKTIEELPEYRIIETGSYGDFVGGFGAQGTNMPIPPSCLPENLRERITICYLMQAISSYESFIDGEERGNPHEPWPADMTARFASEIYQRMNCIRAWKLIPRNAIVALVDTVKTRVLNFVIGIEAEDPDAGEAPLHQPPLSQEKTTQIFNTYISGNVQNVAAGGSDFRQKAISSSGLSDEMFQKLLDAIMHTEADAKIINMMTAIVEEMRGTSGTTQFRKHYLSFMSALSDHIQVFGPVVAPYLPALVKLLT